MPCRGFQPGGMVSCIFRAKSCEIVRVSKTYGLEEELVAPSSRKPGNVHGIGVSTPRSVWPASS